jgi:hypothetical protein
MQIRPKFDCRVIYDQHRLPMEFPISYPDDPISFCAPSSEPVSLMHYHNIIELGYCNKGCGIFFINGKVYSFSTGASSIILKPDTYCQSDPSGRCDGCYS